MIPLRLTISGFLSYRDRAELDFTSFDLACIAGANGAGKSSLLDAITWSLFGQARKRDDSLINSHEDIAEVSFVFSYEGNIYRVMRSKPRNKTTVLEFHILQDADHANPSRQDVDSGTWKPLTERTLRDTEARIQEVLRLDYETFVNASFFLQGKADQFTQQRPGDRKRILSSILGLEVWEKYRQQASDQRRAVEGEISALDGRMQEITSELAEEAARTARLQTLEEDLQELSKVRSKQETNLENIRKIAATLSEQEKMIAILARKMEEGLKDLQATKERLASRQEERRSYNEILARSDAIEKSYAAWQQAQDNLSRWEQVADQFREQEKQRQEPRDEINAARERLLEEKRILEQQQGDVEKTKEEIAAVEKNLTQAKDEAKAIEQRVNQLRSLREELVNAQQKQAEAKAENPRLKAEMEQLKDRIDQLSETEGANCPLCGQPLSQAERQALVENLNSRGIERGDKYRDNLVLMEQTDQRVDDIEQQIASLTSTEAELIKYEKIVSQNTNQVDMLNKNINQWVQVNAPRLAEINTILEGKNYAPEAHARLGVIDEQLQAIGYDAAAHDAVRIEVQEKQESEAEMRTLEQARTVIAPLEREIADLEAQVNSQEAEAARDAEEHSAAAKSLAELKEGLPDQAAAEKELRDLQESENRLRMEVGAARQKVLVLEDLKSRQAALEVERGQLTSKVARFKQLERAFSKDGVPALLIEQALPQIESKSNEILDRLTMGEMSVRFVTQAAYKDKQRKDLRETLEIQISDSAGIRDYEMFSGGEAFRVNFAIRLALAEILAQRAGARLQTLVIDEGFGSQDALGRQRLVEAINLVREDFAKILVITHIDELKDTFPSRIDVEKTVRGSRLTVV